MGSAETFRGYGPEHGYEFLRKAIVENDFAHVVFRSTRMKYSLTMEQKVIQVTLAIYLAQIIVYVLPTPFTPFTLIQT